MFTVNYEQFFLSFKIGKKKTEVYLGPCKHTDITSFTIFTKSSIIDVVHGPGYVSEKLAILEHTDPSIYKKLRIPRIE